MTDSTEEEWRDPALRAGTRCKIFLSFTSNLISAGTREQFKYLVRFCTQLVGVALPSGWAPR